MTNRLIDPQLLERPLSLERAEPNDRTPRSRSGGSNSKEKAMKKSLVALVACMAITILGPSGAQAGDNDLRCTAIVAGPQRANVVVPSGATCLIFRADVDGNVKVEPGGRLQVLFSTIRGSIQSDGGRMVHVFGDPTGPSNVHGDITVKNAPASSDFHTLRGTTIKGSVQFEENRVRIEVVANVLVLPPSITPNAAEGNMQFYKNTGSGAVTGNTIAGNLQCKDNVPAFVAGGNVVGGNTECPG
jgi:hypothetical protein